MSAGVHGLADGAVYAEMEDPAGEPGDNVH